MAFAAVPAMNRFDIQQGQTTVLPTSPHNSPAAAGSGQDISAPGFNFGVPGGSNRNIANTAIQGAQSAGFFDPMGSPILRAALRRNALRSAENQRRRGSVLSRLLGLNPNEARAQQLQTEDAAGTNAADAINQGDLSFLTGNQDFLRSLFSGQLSAENQQALARLMATLQDRNRPGIGAAAGDILGKTIPGIVSHFLP